MSAKYDYTSQAIQEKVAEDLILYSSQTPDKQLDAIKGRYGARTALQCIEIGKQKSGNGPCLGWREGTDPYQFINYEQTLERSRFAAQGLIAKGIPVGQDSRVGVFSANRLEYVLMLTGCYHFSMVPVPLYETLGVEAICHIVNQCELAAVFCDSEARMKILLEKKSLMPTLRLIVTVAVTSEEFLKLAEEGRVEILMWDQLQKLGSSNEVPVKPSKPEDTLMIMYTSGTTGLPKGAILTHDGFLCVVNHLYRYMESVLGKLSPDMTFLSYLPLAHIFENLMQSEVFLAGGKVGFFRGDVRLVFEDAQALKPTLFASVPRLYNRIFDKVMAMVSASRFKNYIFNVSMEQKLEMYKRGKVTNSSFWDSIAFKRVQGMLGGRVNFLVTGSAPMSEKVANFIKSVFGAHFIEGYGQTETHGVIALTYPDEPLPGHVGGPIPCAKVKLVDVPELGYFSKDGVGEICMQGPHLFKGYFRNEAKTRETVDADGWLHSGDIGRINPNGTITIVDRVKHIFKLSQGEYVAPEQVEAIYTQSPAVAQFYLHGDSLQNYCVGVAVPDPEVFPSWIRKHLTEELPEDLSKLCQLPNVIDVVLKEIQQVGKSRGLRSFEQAQVLQLHPVAFSVQNDLLTPTFKAKREKLRAFFKKEVEDMYQEKSQQTKL